jgi:DNA-3-methyladenine glycosylase I
MERYHDEEWGFPCVDERSMFELLSLESFQSGLSWRTVLGKREGFRSAFSNFEPDVVAQLGPADVNRLLSDGSIVRNRAKIEATIANAAAIVALRRTGEPLADVIRAHAPARGRPAPADWSELPVSSPEATALARDLKGRGFRFLGPTTVYSFMQACGVVNDHLSWCPTRPAADRARRAAGLQ